MQELLTQLGINGKALLYQGLNFTLLLIVLTFAVYRPLLKAMRVRREKIVMGLRGAEEAAARITEAEKEKEQRIAAADQQALVIIATAETEAGVRGKEIITVAEHTAEGVLAEAETVAQHRRVQELKKLATESRQLVKEAIIKTVGLDPKAIDEA